MNRPTITDLADYWRENYQDLASIVVGTTTYLTAITTVAIASLTAVFALALLLSNILDGNALFAIVSLVVWLASLGVVFAVQWFTFHYAQ